MKTLKNIYFFAIAGTLIFSCTKEKHIATTLPESLAFEFISTDGKSMITLLRDSVKVSYVENGVTKFYSLSVQKLYTMTAKGADTTKLSTKYNGIFIDDGKFMSRLSSRDPNPIRNYNIYLNGKNMGTLYINYWAYQDSYPKLSSENLTFNGIPTIVDKSIENFEYFSQGSDINLLQVQ